MLTSNNIGIVADDLTGANDTALQFHIRGANTQIILDPTVLPENRLSTQVWAIPTETRNSGAKKAYERAKAAVTLLRDQLGAEYFYKKIDSTLRGNIAVETLGMLEVLDWDAAVVVPAFPQEGRITVGGYHMLKGVLIERTEHALDPQSPIYESHIPTLLRKQIPPEHADLVGEIHMNTIIKGAGPILQKLNELINDGKKLIVTDAMTTTDIEQIVLAMEKSSFNILPCGSAGCAQILGNVWLPEVSSHHLFKTIAAMPRFIVSGSATKTTAQQLQKLDDDDDIDDTYFISLSLDNIFAGVSEELVERVTSNLVKRNIVVVHTSKLAADEKEFCSVLFDKEISKADMAKITTDFLSELVRRVVEKRNAILILVGGETSYKCCKAIETSSLQVIDAVHDAVPLCLDTKGQWIVTKSGNLGNANTLIDILKYFEQHEQE